MDQQKIIKFNEWEYTIYIWSMIILIHITKIYRNCRSRSIESRDYFTIVCIAHISLFHGFRVADIFLFLFLIAERVLFNFKCMNEHILTSYYLFNFCFKSLISIVLEYNSFSSSIIQAFCIWKLSVNIFLHETRKDEWNYLRFSFIKFLNIVHHHDFLLQFSMIVYFPVCI